MQEEKLIGPLVLSIASIDEHFDNVLSAGVAVFGQFDTRGNWIVKKVDRSDVHIRARLWANMADFSHFCYCLCGSADEAYVLHCTLYHRHQPEYGQHPTRPDGSDLQCPVCSKADSKAGSVA